MKSGFGDDEKTTELLGIRPGVWLFALSVCVLCIIAILVNPDMRGTQTNIQPEVKADAAPKVAARERRVSYQHSVTLTPEQAQRLACAIANERAKELYGCEPFSEGAAPDLVDGRWRWFNCRGHGPVDFEARIDFGEDGSAPNVDLQVLDNRAAALF